MAQPLKRTLGELPSGNVSELSELGVRQYLERVVKSDAEVARKKRMAERLRLFHDREMTKYAEDKIVAWFKNEKVRARLKLMAPLATFQNITRRIVEEISVVYAEAADRRVEGKDDVVYQSLLLELGINTKLRRTNEYVNLCNEVLLWYAIGSDLSPQLRAVTPDKFSAIPHPLDATRLAAVVFPIERFGLSTAATDPAWQVWSDYETFQLDGNFRTIGGSYTIHSYGRLPGVLVHRKDPYDRLLDGDSGDDLRAAHDAVLMLNLLMLKEQRSGTKVPYVAGDISQTATGQAMDREELSVFQEGIAPGTLDLGADPRTYIDAARAVIKQVAANYGIPESVFDLSYQATSGFEIELKRVGLREKRRQQIMYPYRPAERQLADVMSAVNADGLPASSFSTERWRIDFGEIEMPRDPMQRLAVFEKRRQLGLMSTVDMVMDENPEMDRKQAVMHLTGNILEEVTRVEGMRLLQAESAGPSTSPEDMTPQEMADEGRAQRPRSGPPPRRFDA